MDKKRRFDTTGNPDFLFSQKMDVIETAGRLQAMRATEICPDNDPVARQYVLRPDILQSQADPSRCWNKVLFVFEPDGVTIDFRPAHPAVIPLESVYGADDNGLLLHLHTMIDMGWIYRGLIAVTAEEDAKTAKKEQDHPCRRLFPAIPGEAKGEDTGQNQVEDQQMADPARLGATAMPTAKAQVAAQRRLSEINR